MCRGVGPGARHRAGMKYRGSRSQTTGQLCKCSVAAAAEEQLQPLHRRSDHALRSPPALPLPPPWYALVY